MARKFLYLIVALLVLAVAALFALRLWGERLAEVAFVPSAAFEGQAPLAATTYGDPAMWFSRPGAPNDPARWRPAGASAASAPAQPVEPAFAVFFVHPTSYLDRARWNASLEDAESQDRARLFLRGMASAFDDPGEVWAPRYRQATFGAFLTATPDAEKAIDAAYGDVALAFDAFLESVGPDTPIVLAGHSQGASHVLRLLREKVAGTPLQARIAMAYPVGWPISREHDLPSLGLPACQSAEQGGCVASWVSFAEPADAEAWFTQYRATAGFDGRPRGDGAILCVNPLTGTTEGAAPASANRGTLVPNAALTDGELVPAAVPARCDERGLLLIGDPPELGPYALPGNNYHVYDIPLFWANLRADVARRVQAWAAAR